MEAFGTRGRVSEATGEIERGRDITPFIENSPYIGLFVLLMLGGVGVPFFPEDATFILCGFLIQAQTVRTIPALLVVYVGVLIADCIIYAFGRKYGRMVVCHKWFHRFLSPEKLQDLEDRFKKKGILFILLGRHFIGLRVQIFIVSGIMRLHPLKFLLADAVTVTFTIAVMVSIGYAGGSSLKDLGIDIIKTDYLAIFLLASVVIGYLIFKYIQKKKSYRKDPENLIGKCSGRIEGSVESCSTGLPDVNNGQLEKKQELLIENQNKEDPRKRLAWLEPLLFLVIVSGVYFMFYQMGLWHFFASEERLFKFIDSMGVWDEAGFVFLEAVQVIIPSIPGMFINMLGGYLYGTVVGVIYSTIGTTIGGYIVFLLSRKFGSLFINRFLPENIMRRLRGIPRNKGRLTIFLLFLIPGFPKDHLCYTLGYLSTIEFLAITTIGRLLGTILETLGGDYIRHKQYQELFILAGIAFIIIFLVLVFRKRLERLFSRDS